MSPKTEAILRSAGWSPDRRVPTGEWVRMLSQDGFDLIPEAEKVMASFGGLTLQSEISPPAAFQPPLVFFDLTMPGGTGDVSRIPDWERRLNTKMNPIGELSYGQAVLVLSEDGRIFESMDGLLYLYGNTFEDALENTLITGNRPPKKIGELMDE